MDELLFRALIAFLAGMLAGIQGAARYVAYKNQSRHRSAPLKGIAETFLSMTCVAWAASLLLYVFRVGFPAEISSFLRWVGIALMFACAPLSVWVFTELGRQFSSKLQLLVDHELVRTGPYRYVRHPMYATLMMCLIGANLASADWMVWTTSIFVAVALGIRIGKEEEMMLERFGRDYEAYKLRAGALFPKLF